jgi:hypothetical protein
MDEEMPRMNEQDERTLAAGLRALAESTRHTGSSPRVKAAVLAGMAGRSRRGTAAGRWFTFAAAAALVLASVSGAWLARNARRPGPMLIHPAGFVEIPGASALPPIESGAIIRIALPVGALPQYGLAIPVDANGGEVDADLLVAQDGVPRAIRLVQDNSSRSTP